MLPIDSINIAIPQQLFIKNSTFKNNAGLTSSLISVTANSNLSVTNCTFMNNYNIARGSIVSVEMTTAVASFY